jgi:hypothetical protein
MEFTEFMRPSQPDSMGTGFAGPRRLMPWLRAVVHYPRQHRLDMMVAAFRNHFAPTLVLPREYPDHRSAQAFAALDKPRPQRRQPHRSGLSLGGPWADASGPWGHIGE